MATPNSFPATSEEASRARTSPLVREAWANALRAGVPLSELKESSVLCRDDGTLRELEALDREIRKSSERPVPGNVLHVYHGEVRSVARGR